MMGDVNVLFVRVSVVALPTNVSVEVGSVRVPVFEIVEMMGDVNVLFVRVSVVALPTNVSVLSGKVKTFAFLYKLPDNRMFPMTCNFSTGLVIPIPTFELNIVFSVELVKLKLLICLDITIKIENLK